MRGDCIGVVVPRCVCLWPAWMCGGHLVSHASGHCITRHSPRSDTLAAASRSVLVMWHAVQSVVTLGACQRIWPTVDGVRWGDGRRRDQGLIVAKELHFYSRGETGQKVSQFLISLNIVSSNGYSDYYLRHASRLVLASGAYRPKFRDYYREAGTPCTLATHGLIGINSNAQRVGPILPSPYP